MVETTNLKKHLSKNPIQKFLINNFYQSLISLIKPLKANSILDVGCGEGFTLVNFRRSKIGKFLEGIDYSKDSITLGKKMYPNLNIKEGNIYKLSYPTNSFDLLVCTEVLEHLQDPTEAIRELARVSKKHIVFSVPNEPFFTLANLLRGKYLKTLGNQPEHINHWTNGGFRKFLRKNGLKISCSKSPFPWALVLARK